ncbi:hypothetical protein QPK31_22760 [Massilia sp. YIM B02769]|jgi:hypothetical protein|nr:MULTISPECIES: hypothetical protein [unclassified Massilia]MDN4061044.1 hypothetical protein [Massilia sp. YIM B02769]
MKKARVSDDAGFFVHGANRVIGDGVVGWVLEPTMTQRRTNRNAMR